MKAKSVTRTDRNVTVRLLETQATKTDKLKPRQRAALERLIAVGKRDTSQSRRVADFLLAWWNGAECGGFDLTDLWAVDPELAEDMVTVIQFIARCHCYPDQLGYGDDFQKILKLWRRTSEVESKND